MTVRDRHPMSQELALGFPAARGLYDPRFEHESCGVDFLCDIKGRARNQIVTDELIQLDIPGYHADIQHLTAELRRIWNAFRAASC